jgi:hypothetical protein
MPVAVRADDPVVHLGDETSGRYPTDGYARAALVPLHGRRERTILTVDHLDRASLPGRTNDYRPHSVLGMLTGRVCSSGPPTSCNSHSGSAPINGPSQMGVAAGSRPSRGTLPTLRLCWHAAALLHSRRPPTVMALPKLSRLSDGMVW